MAEVFTKYLRVQRFFWLLCLSALVLSFLSTCTATFDSEQSKFCQKDTVQVKLSSNQSNKALFPIQIEKRWGFMDVEGRIVIEPKFKAVDRFSEDLVAFKAWEDGLWGYANRQGKIIVDPVFDAAFPFSEGRAVVTLDGSQGIIDRSGEYIVRPGYKQISHFSQRRAFVLVDKSWKVIDENGEYVTENSFSQINSFQEGLASFNGINDDYSKSGYVDRNGEIIIQLDNELSVNIESLGFSHGRATVRKLEPVSLVHILPSEARRNWLYGLINLSGQLVLEPQYNFISVDSPCYARVAIRNRYGLIDQAGRVLIPRQFSYLGEFSEGLAIAQKSDGEKFGYVNEQGKFAIEPFQEINTISDQIPGKWEFPDNRNFYDGRALFQGSNGKYGFINQRNEVVIEPIFDASDRFRNSLAKFQNSDTWGYVNTEGIVVWQSQS